MAETAHQVEAARGPVAGPRAHPLSVACLAFVFVFLLMVLALVVTDLLYIQRAGTAKKVEWAAILAAARLSALTSAATLVLVVLFAVPMGYALSRFRFPGHTVVDTLVDLPIVVPPLVIGVSLLVFFSTAAGRWIEGLGLKFVYSVPGIILCQFLVSASYGIRSAAAAFDAVDRRLEHLALSLGCTPWQAFRHVALPLARNGIVTGSILAWAHAVGIFGPLMVFTGSVRYKTEVLPTTVFLELSVGNIEAAVAVSLLMVAAAMIVLVVVRIYGIEQSLGRFLQP